MCCIFVYWYLFVPSIAYAAGAGALITSPGLDSSGGAYQRRDELKARAM